MVAVVLQVLAGVSWQRTAGDDNLIFRLVVV